MSTEADKEHQASARIDDVLMEAVNDGDIKDAIISARLYLEKRAADDFLKMRKDLFGF